MHCVNPSQILIEVLAKEVNPNIFQIDYIYMFCRNVCVRYGCSLIWRPSKSFPIDSTRKIRFESVSEIQWGVLYAIGTEIYVIPGIRKFRCLVSGRTLFAVSSRLSLPHGGFEIVRRWCR